MVRLILVPVSPSGTGKTLSSLICCFCRLMEAAAWMIHLSKRRPSMVLSCRLFLPFDGGRAGSADDHGVDAHVHAADLGAGGAADDIAHLAHDGAAHRHQVDAVVHDDVQLDGDGGPRRCKVTLTPLAMDSRRSRWTSPSVLERTAMPLTP